MLRGTALRSSLARVNRATTCAPCMERSASKAFPRELIDQGEDAKAAPSIDSAP